MIRPLTKATGSRGQSGVVVLPFPTDSDRQLIHDAIRHFALGECSRRDMMLQIAWIMKKLHITKITIDTFTVKFDQYEGLQFIIIEGKQHSDRCPVCKSSSDHARYLRTRSENLAGGVDCITVTCLECGAIYDTDVRYEPGGGVI